LADMKISDLPAAPDVNDAQQFEVNDSGDSRRVTYQQLRTKIKQGLDSVYAVASHNHNGVYAAVGHHHDGVYAPAAHSHPVSDLSDATALARTLLQAPDQAAARAAIGAGTSDLVLGETAETAKQGDWIPHIDTDTYGYLPYDRLIDVPLGGDAEYTAGETFILGRLFGVSLSSAPNGTTRRLVGAVMVTANGTIRLSLSHYDSMYVQKDGVDVASWGGIGTRTLDLPVTRGQVIRLEMTKDGKYTNCSNIWFSSDTLASPVIPLPVYPVPI